MLNHCFTKHLCLFIGICFLTISGLANKSTAEEGIDLFINACRYQGHNPALIYTGYADIDIEIITDQISQDDIEKQIQKRIAETDWSRISAKFKEGVIESIKNEINHQFHKKTRVSILFSGNEWEKGKRRIEMSTFDFALGKWDSPSVSLSGQYQHSTASVLGVSDVRQVNVLDKPLDLVDFHLFGRMRGIPSRFASVAMLDGTNPNVFKFTANGIQRFKDSVANATKRVGGEAFQIVSEISYDDNALAKQVVSSVGRKKTQEYWIDPARGYVCPVIIFYENGNKKEEYKASHFFLHPKTGLWFPENYEEIEYHPVKASIIKRTVYKIDPQTVKFNEKVSDKEFSVDIPEEYKVVDNRHGKNTVYIADERGELSLATGGLDLDHLSWLRKSGDLPKSQNRFVFVRIFFMIIGIVLIILSIIFKFRKKSTKP